MEEVRFDLAFEEQQVFSFVVLFLFFFLISRDEVKGIVSRE